MLEADLDGLGEGPHCTISIDPHLERPRGATYRGSTRLYRFHVCNTPEVVDLFLENVVIYRFPKPPALLYDGICYVSEHSRRPPFGQILSEMGTDLWPKTQ